MLTFERVAFGIVVVVILSIGACAAHKDATYADLQKARAEKVQKLIESGVDPIAAGCAINNVSSTQCVLAAIKDK